MAKHVQFGTRPVRQPTAEELDQFVHSAGEGAELDNSPAPVLTQQPAPQQLGPPPG